MTLTKTLASAAAVVLLRDWDPIGVGDVPAARREYDMYVPRLTALLRGGATDRSIAAELLDIERDRMGLAGDESRALQVARRLRALTR